MVHLFVVSLSPSVCNIIPLAADAFTISPRNHRKPGRCVATWTIKECHGRSLRIRDCWISLAIIGIAHIPLLIIARTSHWINNRVFISLSRSSRWNSLLFTHEIRVSTTVNHNLWSVETRGECRESNRILSLVVSYTWSTLQPVRKTLSSLRVNSVGSGDKSIVGQSNTCTRLLSINSIFKKLNLAFIELLHYNRIKWVVNITIWGYISPYLIVKLI